MWNHPEGVEERGRATSARMAKGACLTRYISTRVNCTPDLHWIYVFTVFGGEAENIVYTLYLDCICSVFGALYLLCIWSEARYIVYTLYLELLGLYIQSRV